MKSRRLLWVGLVALVGLGTSWSACSSGDNTTDYDPTKCGNALPDTGEQCDDGNRVDTDYCTNACALPRCGDGVQGPGERCDDGNDISNDCCDNNCEPVTGGACTTCGNGTVDAGEECDDGADTAACDGDCTMPSCGDGYVNPMAGEQCEPSELQGCTNCMNPTTSSAGGVDPCMGQAVYKGMVTNAMNPLTAGGGIPSVWSYGGEIGIMAGQAMCQVIAADHVCTYGEVLEADTKGEFANVAMDGSVSFWVHRVTESVPKLGSMGMSAPGPGGRCNDWTYPTNHIADGEYGTFGASGSPPANAREIGNLTLFFDDDTAFDGNPSSNHQCSQPTPGCAGGCGPASGITRAILCCFPTCVPNP